MSLFETKQWWGANIAAGEHFVVGALAVGNVDNETSGQSEWIKKLLFTHNNTLVLQAKSSLEASKECSECFLQDSRNIMLTI